MNCEKCFEEMRYDTIACVFCGEENTPIVKNSTQDQTQTKNPFDKTTYKDVLAALPNILFFIFTFEYLPVLAEGAVGWLLFFIMGITVPVSVLYPITILISFIVIKKLPNEKIFSVSHISLTILSPILRLMPIGSMQLILEWVVFFLSLNFRVAL